jgi:hypothetical protein
VHHLNQEPLDFAASVTLLRKARKDLTEALALLRELNDELKIPGWLQPRVDAVLDRAEGEPTEPAIKPTEEAAHAFWRYVGRDKRSAAYFWHSSASVWIDAKGNARLWAPTSAGERVIPIGRVFGYEVKSCPFCGHEALLMNYVVEAAVSCNNCRANIVRKHNAKSETGIADALRAWNSRSFHSAAKEKT